MQIVISPIFYQGCKRKLINKGLVKNFPTKIRTFYDLFSGSAIISMNVSAKRYVLSDINNHLYELYSAFRDNSSKRIIKHIKNRISKYNLPKARLKKKDLSYTMGRIDNDTLNSLREPYKKNFIKLRNKYNKSKNVLDFITLMYFSFSQQFRFSKMENTICLLGMIFLAKLMKHI